MNMIRFSLDINPERIAAIRALRLNSPKSAAALDKDGSTGVPSEWATHEADMRAISTVFSMPVFTLTGIAEDGTQFKKYFRGGLMQGADATITFPPFDPAQLS
jgi:hypothetical protein